MNFTQNIEKKDVESVWGKSKNMSFVDKFLVKIGCLLLKKNAGEAERTAAGESTLAINL